MKTTLTTKKYNCIIGHREITSKINYKDKSEIIYLKDEINEINFCTTMHFENLIIDFYWHYIGNDITKFGIYICDETDTLFIGGGNTVFTYNLKAKRIIQEQYNDCMFWNFQFINNHILELGELHCNLYNLDGKLLDTTVVDPPYDFKVIDNKIKFESTCFGTTWLHFPEDTKK